MFSSEARLSGEGIVGGDNADEGDYPYQVSLMVQGQSICGGTIYSDRFVITAAHCVIDEEGEFMGLPIKVVAGITDLNVKTKHRVVADVAQIFVLKEYNPNDIFSRPTADIAVLKVKSLLFIKSVAKFITFVPKLSQLRKDLGISSNPNLGKVNLPEEGESYANVLATVSGFGWNDIDVISHPLFGSMETGGTGDDKLRYAKAKVFSNSACQRRYSDTISSKHLCAAVVQRTSKLTEGVCSVSFFFFFYFRDFIFIRYDNNWCDLQGDSGGPLVYENALIGIVSTSPMGCREDSVPAVYTRVSKYVQFVKNVVNGQITKDMRSIKLWRSILS